MVLKNYQCRVLEEKEELEVKLIKLLAFFRSPVYAALSSSEQHRLRRQTVIMKDYVDILNERIAHFGD